jgi:integrative and conjugative element protein (TIGR02256 family)
MTPATSAWISSDALGFLVAEADRAGRVETGGVLLGYWGEPGDQVVVLEALGPGPNAVHGGDHFLPDHEYHLKRIAELYLKSGRRLHYLGDWHTHPGGTANLSPLDRDTLARIAKAKGARAPRPLMMILAPGPRWAPTVWCGSLAGRRWFLPALEVRALGINVFNPKT